MTRWSVTAFAPLAVRQAQRWAWPAFGLAALVLAGGTALAIPDLRAARLVAAFVAFAALASLWQFIRRTNFQVARFIESVRFEDYSQRFSDPSGGGFDVLGDALDAHDRLFARHVREPRRVDAVTDREHACLL